MGEGVELFRAIEGVPKMADHAIKKRVPRVGCINLLTQLIIEERIMNIKLRHRPMMNKGHNEKSANNGHVSDNSECLIIVTSLVVVLPRRMP
jgi:hypothetical protein